jgi:hypothetical protein
MSMGESACLDALIRPESLRSVYFESNATIPKLDWLIRNEDEKAAASVLYRNGSSGSDQKRALPERFTGLLIKE